MEFVFYEERILSKRNMRNELYKKEMSFNFRAGVVYVIEPLPEEKTFRIVEDKTRFV